MKEGGMIHMVGVKSDNYRSQVNLKLDFSIFFPGVYKIVKRGKEKGRKRKRRKKEGKRRKKKEKKEKEGKRRKQYK